MPPASTSTRTSVVRVHSKVPSASGASVGIAEAETATRSIADAPPRVAMPVPPATPSDNRSVGERSDQKEDHADRDEDEEQDLGDVRGAGGNAGEAEDRRDHRDDENRQRPSEQPHDSSPFGVAGDWRYSLA